MTYNPKTSDMQVNDVRLNLGNAQQCINRPLTITAVDSAGNAVGGTTVELNDTDLNGSVKVALSDPASVEPLSGWRVVAH